MHVDSCYLIAHRFPPGVEAVEHAGKDVTHRHVLPPFPPGTDGSHSLIQTRVPGHTRERPQLIQSDDGLHRSTPAPSYALGLIRFSSLWVGRRPIWHSG